MFRSLIVSVLSLLICQVASGQDFASGPVYGPAPDAEAADTPEAKTAPVQASTAAPGTTNAVEGNYTYEGYLALGHGKYVTGDPGGAIAYYIKAKDMDAGRADAYYFIGCAEVAQRKYAQAATTLKTAATIAGEKDVAMHAKSLFMVAQAWDRGSDDSKIRQAYNEYISYVSSHSDVPNFVENANQRIAALDEKKKKFDEYQIVRDRIASPEQ